MVGERAETTGSESQSQTQTLAVGKQVTTRDRRPAVALAERSGSLPPGASRYGLSAELLEKTKARVGIVLWLVFAANGLSFLVRSSRALSGPQALEREWIGLSYVTIALLIATVGLLLTRRKKADALFALRYGMFMMVALGFVVNTGNMLQVAHKYGHLPFLTWGSIAIIIFPLIVPTPPRITLRLAIVTASSSPFGVGMASALGLAEAPPSAYLESLVSPAIAVAVGYFGARVVHGMNQEYSSVRNLGVYRLSHQVGQGGMGEVWQAQHELLARPAAIKVIHPETLARHPDAVHDAFARFEREAQAASQLRSPHTIEIYDFGVADDGSFYYVMELLNGLDLDEFVKRFGAVEPARAVRILLQIATSLSEAHENNLVHRDVKPGNIFLCQLGLESDFVKVLDFGIVKAEETPGTDSIDDEKRILGTPAYIAPEQASGRTEVGPAADVYSLGCVAWWLLTGEVLFPGKKGTQLMAHHIGVEPPSLGDTLKSQVPEELVALVDQCLRKSVELRPESMEEVSARLLAIKEQLPWSPAESNTWWREHLPEFFARRTAVSLSPRLYPDSPPVDRESATRPGTD